MIFLDIPAEEFIDKFPSLGDIILSNCRRENLPISGIRPYITKDYVGAILNPDAKNKIKCFTPRDKEASHILGGLVSSILKGDP